MKVSEYIIDLLIKNGIDTFFAVTGGAIAPLIHAVSKRDVRLVFFQHEQTAAMACEGVFRETGKIAAVLVTSGPGIQNAFNGICGCWYDSIPALFISGQVNDAESLATIKSKPRQRGFQEMPVIESIGHFTVFAAKVQMNTVKETFMNAIRAITSGRYGPALIDLPVNIQMSDFNNNDTISKMISEAKRPLVVYGAGIRHSKSENLIKKLKLPFVTSWAAKDLFSHDDKFNMGCLGVYGSRAANFAVQNCDHLIILGSRLDTRQTGGCLEKFSKYSKKIMVDIDEHEINKLTESGIHIDIPIVCDLNIFLQDLIIEWSNPEWTNTINAWKTKYTHPLGGVYTILDSIRFPDNTTIIPDTGSNLVWTMQTIKIKQGQRIYTNLGNSSMGFSLPCSIGAAISDPSRTIVCIIGDGGLQMNIQELKTIVDYNLSNLKIIVINNSGYGLIKQFQDAYFESNYVGTCFPQTDFCSIANAYGMKSLRFNNESLPTDLFLEPGSILIDVIIDPNQLVFPKLEFGNSLEHMYPFVDLDFVSLYERRERKGWVKV